MSEFFERMKRQEAELEQFEANKRRVDEAERNATEFAGEGLGKVWAEKYASYTDLKAITDGSALGIGADGVHPFVSSVEERDFAEAHAISKRLLTDHVFAGGFLSGAKAKFAEYVDHKSATAA